MPLHTHIFCGRLGPQASAEATSKWCSCSDAVPAAVAGINVAYSSSSAMTRQQIYKMPCTTYRLRHGFRTSESRLARKPTCFHGLFSEPQSQQAHTPQQLMVACVEHPLCRAHPACNQIQTCVLCYYGKQIAEDLCGLSSHCSWTVLNLKVAH